MAYRDDVNALEARVAALSADLAARERERDEAARMLDEARARANAEAFIADLESGGPARRRRKRLRIAIVTSAIAMIVGGIAAYRASSHRDHRFEDAMHKLEAFKGEMCQCKDTACVQHVSDEMTSWSMAMAKEWQPEPRLDSTQMQLASDIAKQMAECMQKAMIGADPAQLAK